MEEESAFKAHSDEITAERDQLEEREKSVSAMKESLIQNRFRILG